MRKKRAGHKSFVVIGMGEFGKNVTLELVKNDADVLAVDFYEEALKEVMDYVTEAVVMDVTDPAAYSKIDLSQMDAVIIAMAEHMDATIMAILQAEEAGVDTIIVKSLNEVHSKIYQKVGATKIIIPEMIEGIGLARALTGENTFEYYELDEDTCIVEILVHKKWVNRTLRELDLPTNFKINVIGIMRDNKVELVMSGDTVLKEGEHLIVATNKKNYKKFCEL